MKFFIIGAAIVLGIFGIAAFVTAGRYDKYDTAEDWFWRS